MAKERKIILPHGCNKMLKELTGYSEITIRHALRGNEGVKNEAKQIIRKRALEIGGVYSR